MRPPCIRIATSLFKILELGYRPRQDISQLVEWDPRSFNGVADHAANCALDMASGFEIEEASLADLNGVFGLRVCVDGALRQNKQGSGGMAVFAYSLHGTIMMRK
eukprot:1733841-Karenia_brevis.AAC.1